MYYHKFTVTGSGNFPLDMLRYDCCFPYGTEDVANLMDSRGKRSITLARYVKYKNAGATTGMWNSFGWLVTVEEHTKDIEIIL